MAFYSLLCTFLNIFIMPKSYKNMNFLVFLKKFIRQYTVFSLNKLCSAIMPQSSQKLREFTFKCSLPLENNLFLNIYIGRKGMFYQYSWGAFWAETYYEKRLVLLNSLSQSSSPSCCEIKCV